MQKWQEKQRQKAHQSKVEKAKSAIRRYSNSRERAPNSGRVKNSTPKLKQTSATPIGKILQIFQLQKYGSLLASYGFPEKLTNRKSLQYIDQMMQQVAQKDKQKFLSLLSTLTIMSKDVQRQSKTPKSSSKPNKVYYPPPPSSSVQYRHAPNSVQKSQKASIKFRVKQKNTITALIANKKNESRNAQLNSRQSQNTRENSQSTEKRRKKSVSHYQSKATDDLSLVYDFPIDDNNVSGLLRPVKQSNKIIQKLLQKLESLQPPSNVKQNTEEVNLQMQKIKHMYLSFDSATLTSNILNIDMHQMIQCFAMEVKQLITRGEIANLAKSNADKIKSLLHQSFILAKQESKQSRNLNEGQYLAEKMDGNSMEQLEGLEKKQSNFTDQNTSIKKFQEMREIDAYNEDNQNIQDMCDTDRSSEGQAQSKCSIDLNKGMKESSIWGNSYIASVINDFSCFDNTFQGTIYMQPPQQEDLKNFIELVVMAGRMQKQVPIIAYIYLKRLLSSSMVKQGKVSQKNWRNLMLVTLVEASKIWDDQSLQNHSFAKFIKPYTTLEINRLEKYLLFFLDYHLTIDQKQYSQAYFELRKHIGEKKSTQSANLMKLDLRTIKKLQQSGIYGTGSGNSRKNIMEKKQHFKRLLNKSF